MASGGTYRIDDTEFPAPIADWEAEILGGRLDGLPALVSFSLHKWSWQRLESCYMERLLDLFLTDQQAAETQLSVLETDPHDVGGTDGAGANQGYGTVVYDNFVIKEVYPIKRGYPHYDNAFVVFEVYTP